VKWTKRGLVYAPPGDTWWARRYALPPTPLALDDDVIRIYVGFCDDDTVGRLGYVDVAADDPGEVLGVAEEPLLDIGEPGLFDDSGVVPTCALRVGDDVLLYYVGFQRGTRVPYFQFAGLAISRDGGSSFEKVQRTPVIDRSDAETMHRTSTFVRHEGDRFRMWYVAGDAWTQVGEKLLPIYNIRTVTSPDGVSWQPEGTVCIDFDDPDEHAFGRPWIIRRPDGWRMLYSVRTRTKDYRLGLAVSEDGERWERRDHEVGIDVSPEGWDSELIAYGSVVEHGDRAYLFYNGNARGASGFGWAELESWGTI
jgi:predicted GH43/DUF377 family glycosyl hydrolase